MPYADLLRGLKALFLEKPEAKSVDALLSSRAPGLSAAERRVLTSIPDDRLAIYVGLLRENQATMLDFVAASTVEVMDRFAGVPRREFARATLVDTPRRTSRLRELSQRVLDHLAGAGRAAVERGPAILDLARLERAQTEAFYALDVEGSLSPPEFAERVTQSTVDEVLAYAYVVAPSVRIVALEFDVLAWRDRRFESGTWDEPPPRLGHPIEILVARDPHSLQPASHRIPAALLELLRPTPEAPRTLESLAERWLEASGTSPDDEQAPAKFFEQAAEWVRHGILLVIPPSAPGPGFGEAEGVAPA
jgi:hypothetical protein